MPLSKQHKDATRQRIVTAAGRAFRHGGAAATSVAAVMADAGLTHGGFYAHFASKEALLAEVMAHDHGFIRHLARRESAPASRWAARTVRVFADYLHPAHLHEVALGCSFAALTGDAARAPDPVREGYRDAWQQLVGEVLRGPGESPDAALAAASAAARESAAALAALAIGSVAIARVLAPHKSAAALLRGAAREALARLAELNALRAPPPAAARRASRPATAARTGRTAAPSTTGPSGRRARR